MSHDERLAHVAAQIQAKPKLSRNGEVALAYARAGFFVFQCSAERKKHEEGDRLPFGKADKRPIVAHWGIEASKNEAQIREWWTKNPEALVALPCKQNRLLVIDCDRHTVAEDGIANFKELCEAHEPLPSHPAINTDYEGQHHILRMPDESIGQGKNKLPPGVDVRGYLADNEGGYIIAAGSRMPDGRGWSLVKGTPSLLSGPLPLPPQWLIDLCRTPLVKPVSQVVPFKPAGKAEDAYAMATLNRVADELAGTPPNTGRDNTLMSVSATMGRMIAPGWIGEATVEGRLIDACKANGLEHEAGRPAIRDKIKRGIETGIKNPHEPLPERPAKENGKDGSAPKLTVENKKTPSHS
jgi:hypothetical protein